MLFIISCVDKPEPAHLRTENRSDHLSYLENLGDNLVAAGPTLTDDGEVATGSVLIVRFDNRAEAEVFAQGDPYNKAGLFESVSVKRWKQVFPSQTW